VRTLRPITLKRQELQDEAPPFGEKVENRREKKGGKRMRSEKRGLLKEKAYSHKHGNGCLERAFPLDNKTEKSAHGLNEKETETRKRSDKASVKNESIAYVEFAQDSQEG